MEMKVELSTLTQIASEKEATVLQVSKTMFFCPSSWLYIPFGKFEVTLTKYWGIGRFSLNDYLLWKKTKSVFRRCPIRTYCKSVAKIVDYGVFFCTDCVFNRFRKNEEKLAELKFLGQMYCNQADAMLKAIQNSEIEHVGMEKVEKILRAVCPSKKRK